MTGMLASVRNLREAECALKSGVDLIDLKEPGAGALGALASGTAARIVEFINGRIPVSATIGDLPFESHALRPAIDRMSATGADIIKVGMFGDVTDQAALGVLHEFANQGLRIVLVLFAEEYAAKSIQRRAFSPSPLGGEGRGEGSIEFQPLSDVGIFGIMLDTSDKTTGSLTQKLPAPVLERFVHGARSAGLLTGLAGSLRQVDITPLLEIGPDYLGFRGALCRNGARGAELEPEAILRIRTLIKAGGGPDPDWLPDEWGLAHLIPSLCGRGSG